MRIGIDGRKIPQSAKRGPIGSLEHGKALGMEGLFFRTILDMSRTLDRGLLAAIRSRADELGLYLEAGLGKVNPYATPEAPELRAVGDGDIALGFRRMMEASAAIGCVELWVSTANRKPTFYGRLSYDRFRTDAPWSDQLAATERFLKVLAPIARDLGIHMNIETHEEIASFEVVRLVEAVGPDVVGVVLDTSNMLHRAEHPVRAAKRVAPYVRQTHLKDAYVAMRPGGVLLQNRPCGDGAVDFAAIIAILLGANPKINLTIENAEPHAERTIGRTQTCVEIFDPRFHAGHPDLDVEEFAAYLKLVRDYEKGFGARGVLDWAAYEARPFGHEEAVAEIKRSAAHLLGALSKARFATRQGQAAGP